MRCSHTEHGGQCAFVEGHDGRHRIVCPDAERIIDPLKCGRCQRNIGAGRPYYTNPEFGMKILCYSCLKACQDMNELANPENTKEMVNEAQEPINPALIAYVKSVADELDARGKASPSRCQTLCGTSYLQCLSPFGHEGDHCFTIQDHDARLHFFVGMDTIMTDGKDIVGALVDDPLYRKAMSTATVMYCTHCSNLIVEGTFVETKNDAGITYMHTECAVLTGRAPAEWKNYKGEFCPYTERDLVSGKIKRCKLPNNHYNPDHYMVWDKDKEAVDHPSHYGGADNPYEHIKVADAWELNYRLGNCTKYIARAGKKNPDPLEDLRKARWYLDDEIKRLEKA